MDTLRQEIFALAYHLHWQRDQILVLPIPERLRYLELLQEQLERERKSLEQGNMR